MPTAAVYRALSMFHLFSFGLVAAYLLQVRGLSLVGLSQRPGCYRLGWALWLPVTSFGASA
jgi:hypothetical protein